MMPTTPLSVMERLAGWANSWTNPWSPSSQMTQEEIVAEAFGLLRPFLTNPERHEQAVKLLIEGACLSAAWRAMEPMLRLYNSGPLRALRPFINWTSFHEARDKFLKRLGDAQADLRRSLTPVELDADILPISIKSEGTLTPPGLRLAVFRINVSLYKTEFSPQSLSVRLAVLEPDFQFVDVEPSSKTEAVGGYEIGVSQSGKFVEASKTSGKLAFELNGQLAKVKGDATEEKSSSAELGRSISAKETGQHVVPMVISSAIKGTARWELLRTPTQSLLGGTSFLATAFVAVEPRHIPVELRVATELDGWGPYELVLRKEIAAA
jgi:hypothetical protein